MRGDAPAHVGQHPPRRQVAQEAGQAPVEARRPAQEAGPAARVAFGPGQFVGRAQRGRLADLALMVGRRLGLSDPALAVLRQGALLHDIGKLGVDPAIVRKDGPLTGAEYAQMQQHPLIGERIVRPLRLAAAVAPIVRHHHERWDGRGYPDRLQGEEIPLEARIIFACDAFHAMTTDRPYRDALTVDEAFVRLADAAGTQFDPAVVEICLRVLKQPPPLE